MSSSIQSDLAREFNFHPPEMPGGEFRPILLEAALTITRAETHPHINYVIAYKTAIAEAEPDLQDIRYIRLMYWIHELRMALLERTIEFNPVHALSEIPWLTGKRDLILDATRLGAGTHLKERAVMFLARWHQLVADNSELLIRR